MFRHNFFTPCMKKVDNGGGKNGKRGENNTEIIPTYVIASQLPERRPTATATTCANLFDVWSYAQYMFGSQLDCDKQTRVYRLCWGQPDVWIVSMILQCLDSIKFRCALY